MHRIILVGLLILITYSARAQDGRSFWHGLRWGMMRSEVIAAMPNASDYTTVSAGKKFKEFGLEHYDVAGCSAHVSLTLTAHGLENINIGFDVFNLREAENCKRVIVDGLINKYGPPINSEPKNDQFSHQFNAIWLTSLSHIELLMVALVRETKSREVLVVIYRPRDSGAAGAL